MIYCNKSFINVVFLSQNITVEILAPQHVFSFPIELRTSSFSLKRSLLGLLIGISEFLASLLITALGHYQVK
jgi:hypothetical protein